MPALRVSIDPQYTPANLRNGLKISRRTRLGRLNSDDDAASGGGDRISTGFEWLNGVGRGSPAIAILIEPVTKVSMSPVNLLACY